MRLNHRHSFNKKVFALFLAVAMAFEGSYAVPAYAQEAGKGMEESISSEAQAKESSSIMQDEAEWEEDALDGEQSEDTGTIEGLTDGTEEKPGEGAVEEGTRIQEEASEKEKTTAPGEGTEKEKTEIQGREPEKEEAAGSKKGEETADVEMEEEENEDAMEQNDSEEEGVGEDKEGVFNGIETLDEDSVLKAANASSGKCGKNLTWKLDGKGVLTISGQGEMEDYPNYYPEGRKTPWPEDSVKRIIIGKGVNNIGEGAFAECTNLTELKIPVGLDEIGDSSFYGCSNLKDITIPDSVKKIGGGAFGKCNSLKNIVIPESVKDIDNNAFQECNGLETIIIRSKSTRIGGWAFCRCNNLRSIETTDRGGVTSIEAGAFMDCGSLRSVKISNGLTYIGDNAFYGCKNLVEVKLPDVVTNIGLGAFRYCGNLSAITLPNKLKNIGIRSFGECSGLKRINIPEGVEYIGESAFSGCSSMENITVSEKNNIVTLGANAFGGTAWFRNQKEDFVMLENILVGYGGDATTIAIPEKVTVIGSGVLGGWSHSSIEEITFAGKNNITNVGEGAFSGTGWFQNQKGNFVTLENILLAYRGGDSTVKIPGQITIIADGCFRQKKDVKSVVLHNNVTTLGASSFSGSGVASITIPGSVANVAYCTFQGCSALECVVLGEGVKGIGLSAFANSKNIKEITIPKSVNEIENFSIGYRYSPQVGYGRYSYETWDASGDINRFPLILCFKNSVAYQYALSNEKLYQFLDGKVKAVSKCKISLPASSFPYTGDPITPAVSIKDGAKKLKEGTDYLIRYEDNEGVGTATIKITGIGYYSGTVTKKFTIKSPAPKFIYKKSYSKTYGDKAFSLNIKQTGGSEKLSYSSSNKKVAAVNSSGKVTMKGTGLAIITVKSAVSRTVLKITVKVSPVRQKISSVKAVKGKKLTVVWKKDTTASGYRIQYSTDKKFKKGFKDVWVRKNKTKNTTVSKLKAGKKYYIRICSYKNIKENGKSKKLYGKWSNVVLSQKIKK